MARLLKHAEARFLRDSVQLVRGRTDEERAKVIAAVDQACYEPKPYVFIKRWRRAVVSQIDPQEPAGPGATTPLNPGPYTLSTGGDARAVAAQIQEHVDRLLEEADAFAPRNETHALRVVMKRVHRERLHELNPVDRLKVLDAECDILDSECARAGLEETRAEHLARRKREIRRASNYEFILTEEASGPEKSAQRWLARTKGVLGGSAKE